MWSDLRSIPAGLRYNTFYQQVSSNRNNFNLALPPGTVGTFIPKTDFQPGLFSIFTAGNFGSGIAFWVAGTPSLAAGMPAIGTATYAGHAVASIATGPAANPSAQYLAGANFTSTVDYAARNATFSIPNLDGANYNGGANFNANSATFGGTLGSSVAGRTLSLNGTLFQAGPASPVGEIGGHLAIQGTNYLASGIFLGKK